MLVYPISISHTTRCFHSLFLLLSMSPSSQSVSISKQSYNNGSSGLNLTGVPCELCHWSCCLQTVLKRVSHPVWQLPAPIGPWWSLLLQSGSQLHTSRLKIYWVWVKVTVCENYEVLLIGYSKFFFFSFSKCTKHVHSGQHPDCNWKVQEDSKLETKKQLRIQSSNAPIS